MNCFIVIRSSLVVRLLERKERSGVREDARATVPDQQVNSRTPRYPVDRYLVERSNKLEMVNIIDDNIWNAEPALRPEDEIVLKKLHDMLQSTADDLKLLSGELSKYHEPGVQVKSLPTPLDEEFNEKVHIEELVNAKFHGYKVVDKPQPTLAKTHRDKVDGILKSMVNESQKPKRVNDAGIQVSEVPIFKKLIKKTNLSVSGTKTIQITENVNKTFNRNIDNCTQQNEKINQPTVAYKELSFTYKEPIKLIPTKPLQVQNMPSINIRSELREQKVLNLNIEPKLTDADQNDANKRNVTVISIQHEPITTKKPVPTTNIEQVHCPQVPTDIYNKKPKRIFSKMSSCESSEIDSHSNVDVKIPASSKISRHRITKTVLKLPSKPRTTENIKNKKNANIKKESAKHHTRSNLEEWKKKLNAVYGCPSSSRKSKIVKPENKAKSIEIIHGSSSARHPVKTLNNLNNAEYIPYSKLTLGGVRISDIEKGLSDVPVRHDITPILNKILSRENSFQIESTHVDTAEDSPKILTTSDEDLLREVLDIETRVNKTLTSDFKENNIPINNNQPKDNDDQDSYVDDFEDEKSDSIHSQNSYQLSDEKNLDKTNGSISESGSSKNTAKKEIIQNKTLTKQLNLTFKENVDIFEFVHSIDTQETGTQSNSTQKISLKETQTSPRNDRCSVQPIHNDLWPSIDPKGEVEKLFQLEKDFIKKLIVDEYGDLLEKNLNKPSTSKHNQSNDEKNIVVSQKNTQTSPAHVKSVMTSPTRTKTRMTSPFALSLTMDKQTSPIREELKVGIEDGDDLAISINLSSPRFSLRLPQTSREVISNLESHAQSNVNHRKSNPKETRMVRKKEVSSSSSADGDYSSSDISSLGEIRLKLKRRLQKLKVPSISELSTSTSMSKYSSDVSDAIVPLRSEGEVSLGQVNRRKPSKNNKSEGETSFGCLY